MLRNNLIDAIRLPFRKEKALYRSFFSIMGFYPRQISYYKEALLHRSASTKCEGGKLINNERLEFLGDAILGAAVGDIVFHHFERKQEGFLTTARSKIVQRETLGRVSEQLGLHHLIHSNSQSNGHNSYMAGNALEALVGAIYLDRGYDYCMRFIETRILGRIIDLDKIVRKEINFKSKLLEFCQKHHLGIEYQLVNEERDSKGAPYFRSKILIEGLAMGVGKGYSKKESHQQASKNVLNNLKNNRRLYNSLVQKYKVTHESDKHHTALPEAQGA